MTIVLYVIMLFCIFRCVQEVIARNYKKATFCLIGTQFLFIAMNGEVYMVVNQLRLVVGDTMFNVIVSVLGVMSTIFIGICFWQSIKDIYKKS